MGCYRRALKIGCVEMTTNNEVLRPMGEGQKMWTQIVTGRNQSVGHVLRRNRLLKTNIED